MNEAEFNNISDHMEFTTNDKPYQLFLRRGVYSVVLYGASGGYTTFHVNNDPGKGGMTKGILQLKAHTTLYLYVGGKGGDSNRGTPGKGGFNGGIIGGSDISKDNDCASGGSGGATDIRIEGGDWNDTQGLRSRIMVAAGGGSAGCYIYAGKGGDGGGVEGMKGGDTAYSQYGKSVSGGSPGTQRSGSHFGYGGKGQDGTYPSQSEAAGSGGGGYWGGYGGVNSNNGASGSGGGGGSSFISGHDGCIAINKNGEITESSKHYSGIIFTHTSMKTGANLGDGKAIIDFLFDQIVVSYVHKCSFFHIPIIFFIIFI